MAMMTTETPHTPDDKVLFSCEACERRFDLARSTTCPGCGREHWRLDAAEVTRGDVRSAYAVIRALDAAGDLTCATVLTQRLLRGVLRAIATGRADDAAKVAELAVSETCAPFDRAHVRKWMEAHRGAYRDSAGEVQAGAMAEGAALAFDMEGEDGPLDDEHHWLWDVAVDVATTSSRR